MRALFICLVLSACGTSESSDSSTPAPVLEPTAAPKTLTAVTVSQSSALVGVSVQFDFEYSEPIMGTALTPAVVVIEEMGIPLLKCSTKFIYKYGEDAQFLLTPGKKYRYRACLFNTVTREYVEGVAGEFQTE